LKTTQLKAIADSPSVNLTLNIWMGDRFNDYFCEISGYSKNELIGSMFGIEQADKHSSTFYKALWTAIQRGRIWRGEICNRHKNGNLYWISTVIVPTLDSESNKIKLIILSLST
jgi:PAS domain S-box-containing protein